MSSLSLAMIVRNEARWIGECLAAIRSHVDEMVVADTGSDDGTPDAARQHGARVIEFPWVDDFAAARNASLDAATGDWALVLDADEILSNEDAARLRCFIEGEFQAHRLVQRTYSADSTLHNWRPLTEPNPWAGGLSGFYDVRLIRLFKRCPNLRYTGRIHEMVEPEAERHGIAWNESDLIMHHRQFLNPPQRQREKALHYLELSKRKTAENPDDARAFRELGQAAMQLADYDQAAEALYHAVALDPTVHDQHINLVAALCKARRQDEALGALHEALRRFPSDPALLEAKGEAHQALGQWREAIESHGACLAIDPNHFRAHNNLAVVHLNTRDPNRAMRHLDQARRLNPTSVLPLFNLGLAHMMKGSINRAQRLFDQALTLQPDHWLSMIQLGDIEFNAQRIDEAMGWYSKADAVEGRGSVIDAKICSCLLTRGEWDQALERAERAADSDPAMAKLVEQVRALIAQNRGDR